jgi:hypothetical protein
MPKATVVTALFDIGRSQLGDGRTIAEYLGWFEKTLSLNANFVIFIHDKLYDQLNDIINKIGAHHRVCIYKLSLEELPYYNYITKISEIMQNPTYRQSVKYYGRIETINPLYPITIFSKFKFLTKAIEEDPYKSEHFFWMDAGCSRFFQDVDLTKSWPDLDCYWLKDLLKDKIIVQSPSPSNNGHFIYEYPDHLWNNFLLSEHCLLLATVFGGIKESLIWYADMIENILNQMVSSGVINNEQIAMAIIWKQYPERFIVHLNYQNITHFCITIFKALSKDCIQNQNDIYYMNSLIKN